MKEMPIRKVYINEEQNTEGRVDEDYFALGERNDERVYPAFRLREHGHQACCPEPGTELKEFSHAEKANDCDNRGVQYIVGNPQCPVWQSPLR